MFHWMRSPRPKSKQLPMIKELGEAGFNFVFEGSDLVAKATEGLSPETHPHLYREMCWKVEERGAVGETTLHVCVLLQSQGGIFNDNLGCGFPLSSADFYFVEEGLPGSGGNS